jgi:hypothetical protein
MERENRRLEIAYTLPLKGFGPVIDNLSLVNGARGKCFRGMAWKRFMKYVGDAKSSVSARKRYKRTKVNRANVM